MTENVPGNGLLRDSLRNERGEKQLSWFQALRNPGLRESASRQSPLLDPVICISPELPFQLTTEMSLSQRMREREHQLDVPGTQKVTHDEMRDRNKPHHIVNPMYSFNPYLVTDERASINPINN